MDKLVKKITDFKNSKIHAIYTDKNGKTWITHTYRYGSSVTEELTLNASPIDYLWEPPYVRAYKGATITIKGGPVIFYRSKLDWIKTSPLGYISNKLRWFFKIKKHQLFYFIDGFIGARVEIKNNNSDVPCGTMMDYSKSCAALLSRFFSQRSLN